MKLVEIFQSSDHGGERDRSDSRRFIVKKRIGDRTIHFSAGLIDSIWEVNFAEEKDDGSITVDKTGSGNEVEVFSFVMNCMRDFIDEHNPKRMVFSATKSEDSRVKLYQRLVNRFAKDYTLSQTEVGTGPNRPKALIFDLTRKQ